MDLRKQIITALGLDEKTSLEWQAKLTDGTIVVSPAPELEAGVEISILTEDGSTMPLAAGAYETEDGVGFTVEEDGIVASLLTEEQEAPSEEEPTEEVEMDEEDGVADIKDWEGLEKRVQQLEDAIADLKADKDGGDDEVETEDGNEEELSRGPKTIKKTEVTEFTKLKKENKELKKMLKEAAANKLNVNKFSTAKKATKLSKKQLDSLTPKERFMYNLNNK
jgi:hypothetical protein